MKILLTGANGFIGSTFKNYAIANKEDIEFICSTRNFLNPLDYDSLEDLFSTEKIDFIIHTAVDGGRRNKIEDASVFYNNLLMFENLMKFSNKVKGLLFFGSGAEFDRFQHVSNVSQADFGTHIPNDYYGFSKYVMAKRISNFTNAINLRIFNCFGELEKEDRMIKSNIRNCLQGLPLIIHQDRKMDFFYAEDACRVISFLINNWDDSLPQHINLSYSNKVTLFKIATLINNLFSFKCEIKVEKPGFEKDYYGCSQALETLGIELIGLKGGLQKMYQSLSPQKL